MNQPDPNYVLHEGKVHLERARQLVAMGQVQWKQMANTAGDKMESYIGTGSIYTMMVVGSEGHYRGVVTVEGTIVVVPPGIAGSWFATAKDTLK